MMFNFIYFLSFFNLSIYNNLKNLISHRSNFIKSNFFYNLKKYKLKQHKETMLNKFIYRIKKFIIYTRISEYLTIKILKKRGNDFLKRSPKLSQLLKWLNIYDNREYLTEYRTIYINNIKPDDYDETEDAPIDYTKNQIRTSKVKLNYYHQHSFLSLFIYLKLFFYFQYRFYNFLPKNLLEQFRRIANLYFLINALILFFIPNPPTSPYTGILPLFFVIGVSMFKQGYEDLKRHKEDRIINNTKIRIIKNGQLVDKNWQDIQVGDIVECINETFFPCDMILLYSKTKNSLCYMTTASLDGETNLKLRSVPNKLPMPKNEIEAGKLRGVIKCDKPNTKLHEYRGKIIINGRQYPVNNDNILLKGAKLKIAPVIYGCAIYTGQDTKMMKNSKFKSNKLSCIEKFVELLLLIFFVVQNSFQVLLSSFQSRKLNEFILYYIILLFSLLMLCLVMYKVNSDIYETNWYLKGFEPDFFYTNQNLANFLVLMLYLTILNYLVPLSLYVTIELQRFIGSKFIEWDLEMFDEEANEIAKANTSNLNEDLGQVEYLFTDKTGTLTLNEMEFKQFEIDGVLYEENGSKLCRADSQTTVDISKNDKLVSFFQLLTLCHSVQIDNTAQDKYQASSPDEYSFIKFCSKYF
jgi:phospholipid-translocating ATPase